MKGSIFSIFLRTFFIESVWNYERMQNVGFAFSIIPHLKKLYEDKKMLAKKVKTHFGFFNTHPYLVGLILGIAMRLEEDCAKGSVSEDIIIKNKTMLSGPVAAIGDRLIWSTWRIFCSILVSSYLLIYGKNFYNKVDVFSPVIFFLLVYNLVGHLPIRFFSLYFAYNYSKKILEEMSKFSFQRIVKIIRSFGLLILIISSFIYSLSLIDVKRDVVLFWINILFSILLTKKYDWVISLVSLFIFNFLLFWLVIK